MVGFETAEYGFCAKLYRSIASNDCATTLLKKAGSYHIPALQAISLHNLSHTKRLLVFVVQTHTSIHVCMEQLDPLDDIHSKDIQTSTAIPAKIISDTSTSEK